VSQFEDKKSIPLKDATKKHPIIKELQEKAYHVLDFHLLGMPDDLLKKGVIQLTEPKHPEEAVRTTNLKNYWYHRVINHPLEKCIAVKEHIT